MYVYLLESNWGDFINLFSKNPILFWIIVYTINSDDLFY